MNDDSVRRPGRWCPPSYGLGAGAFARAPRIAAELVYVVGGLYGNPLALQRAIDLFEREPAADKCMIFNGDFHWFDRDAAEFQLIEAETSRFVRLRGNVETELASLDEEAGCGCAYPDSVDEGDVARSNEIMSHLKQTAAALGLAEGLGRLPAVARVVCGNLECAITHGDDESIAGWQLAFDRVEHAWEIGLGDRMAQMGVRLIASSHTCLAVASSRQTASGVRAVINNGAAGMANFLGDPSGLITRIAHSRWTDRAPVKPVYSTRIEESEVSAIPVRFDVDAWHARFLAQWPEGSPAHLSYWHRIVRGPNHSPARAARGAFITAVCEKGTGPVTGRAARPARLSRSPAA